MAPAAPQPPGWTVRAVQRRDAARWEQMREELWPASPGEHAVEIEQFFDGQRRRLAEVLVALDEHGRPVGFAELSIRSHADGCDTDRIAYLEGWFVERAYRRQGAGAALVRAAEEWGRAQGCKEFASDTDIDNTASAAAHTALGFAEMSRIICFRKQL